MKYCSHCGAELLDEAIVCPKCGCPVVGSALDKKEEPKKSAGTKTELMEYLSIGCASLLALVVFLANIFSIWVNFLSALVMYCIALVFALTEGVLSPFVSLIVAKEMAFAA